MLKVGALDIDEAIECALITVNEILKTCPQKENEVFGISKGIEYWKEVETEIRKM